MGQLCTAPVLVMAKVGCPKLNEPAAALYLTMEKKSPQTDCYDRHSMPTIGVLVRPSVLVQGP